MPFFFFFYSQTFQILVLFIYFFNIFTFYISTCDGESSTDCLSCFFPLYLEDRECITQCSLGHLWNASSRVCENCIDNCWTCETLSDCLVCETGYVLHEGICLDECPLGFYPDSNGIYCLPCNEVCKGCTGNRTD
jgi:proprotein convertase subtilisin/kexin type 5